MLAAAGCAMALPAWASVPETLLYSFTGGSDGQNPIAGLVMDAAGNLYGTTTGLYDGSADVGTVFKVAPNGQETVLHVFTGTPDGSNPYAGLLMDASGNLLGTTRYGGTLGWGTVFKIDTSGVETILYNFTGDLDGSNPTGALALDGAGNIYGTTTGWGTTSARNPGNVFKLDSAGNETVLYNFTGGIDGDYPEGLLVLDAAGNVYGTTYYGGSGPGLAGYGVVFMVDAGGHETVLHTFDPGTGDGSSPLGGLIQGPGGFLYGTTSTGGANGFGTVFRVDIHGNETILYNFAGSPDGDYPARGLAMDAVGNYYGTTGYGGTGGGTVFRLTPAGAETVVYSFGDNSDGMTPYTDLVIDALGNLFGTTVFGGAAGNGAVFKVQVGLPLLSFPLANRTAFTAKINSVFDHSSQYQYCPDRRVIAYDGESGTTAPAVVANETCGLTGKKNRLSGFEQTNGQGFSLNGQYDGGGDPYHLNYDGHPGYDYKTIDQDPSGNIAVFAAAGGTVVCVNISGKPKGLCSEGPGEIKVDHGNGYFTIYLHLSQALVAAGNTVTNLQQLGVSGDTGVEGNPHLHFEVRKGTTGSSCASAQTCIPVDPYGWTGSGADPYTRGVNINLWQ
jgi:uncharacterized repeat protein (TIGR03803 family)